MSSDLDKLERLHALLEQGALSEEEYQREKVRVLSANESVQSPSRTAPLLEPDVVSSPEFEAEEVWEDEKTVRSKLLLILIAIVLIAVCGSAYWFFASQDHQAVSGTATPAAKLEPGQTDSGATKPVADAGLPPKADLLGKAYGDSLQGKPFDPAAGIGEEGSFDQTLSGPQTPSVAIRFDGKEVLIWENCMAHNCPHARSLIGIEVDGQGRFVATIVDGRTEIIRSAWFGRELLSHCAGYTCEFDTITQPTGQQGDISPLTDADLGWSQGGASCRAESSANQMVFYTEGEAAIRFKGRLRRISESDGIGAGPWYTNDGPEDELLVEIEERDGPRTTREEQASYPAFLKVFDGEWTSIPVIMTCEA